MVQYNLDAISRKAYGKPKSEPCHPPSVLTFHRSTQQLPNLLPNNADNVLPILAFLFYAFLQEVAVQQLAIS